ncbi:hypothetical protein ACFOEP_12660 [Microbacterium amylolyticum]|uniref:hypothetical protein n=1 Tax=Microbacterium amylolyticum TaxID=936337 RepID=UPI0036084DD9
MVDPDGHIIEFMWIDPNAATEDADVSDDEPPTKRITFVPTQTILLAMLKRRGGRQPRGNPP